MSVLRLCLAATGLACTALAPLGAQASFTPDTVVTMRSVGSTLEFVPDRIALKTGTRVRIRYTNDGTLPHNIVFVKDEEDLDALAAAAYQAGTDGYVPMALKDKLIAWSPLLSAGKSADLDFVVPPPGEYPFICLFPGHSGMMLGTIRSLR